MPGASQPALKSLVRRWFLRLYFVLALAGPLVGVGYVEEVARPYGGLIVVSLMPVFLSIFAMAYNLTAFPFRYSVLGAYKRTPFPDEEPLVSERGTTGAVDGFRSIWSYFCWRAFPSGLGITMPLVGRAFIPVEEIDRLIGSTLHHTSPELRSPVKIGSPAVVEAVREMLGERSETAAGTRGLGEKISERLGVPVPRIRALKNHHVLMSFVFVSASFPNEDSLNAVAAEAAALLSERDPHFRAEEHLTIRFAHGERTRTRWRNGKLEMTSGKPDNAGDEA